jgi:hypothetical protein
VPQTLSARDIIKRYAAAVAWEPLPAGRSQTIPHALPASGYLPLAVVDARDGRYAVCVAGGYYHLARYTRPRPDWYDADRLPTLEVGRTPVRYAGEGDTL